MNSKTLQITIALLVRANLTFLNLPFCPVLQGKDANYLRRELATSNDLETRIKGTKNISDSKKNLAIAWYLRSLNLLREAFQCLKRPTSYLEGKRYD